MRQPAVIELAFRRTQREKTGLFVFQVRDRPRWVLHLVLPVVAELIRDETNDLKFKSPE